MRDSAIIYRSFFEAIRELPEKNQCECWNAVFTYALDFKEPELTGISKTVFTLIKPQLEANIKRYKNGLEPKTPTKKAKRKQNGSKTEANANVNKNVNVNANEKEKEKLKAEITKSLSGNGRTPDQVEQVATEQVAEFEKDFQSLTTWVKTNTPRVGQMKEPLTLTQFFYLRHKIPDKQKVRDLLLSMHNWKDLTSKNVSAYLTILKWSKNGS